MKKFVRALLILVMIIMTVTALGCGGNDVATTLDSEFPATNKVQAIVNVIQRGESVDVSDLVIGMSEKSFEPVEEAISAVVKGANPRQIKISLVEWDNKFDIDNNPYFYGVYNIEYKDKNVEVEVVYLEDVANIYKIELK